MKGFGTLAGVALALATVGGCDGQGEGAGSALPSVTQSVTQSVTRTVTRTPVRPTATRSQGGPTAAPSSTTAQPPTTQPPTTQPPTTQPPTTQPPRTTQPPSPTQAPSPTSATTVTTLTMTPSPTSSATPPAAATTAAAEGAADDWVWWALGLLAVAAVVTGAVLIRRHRTQVEWSAGLADALAEVTWLSHDLVPGLLAQAAAGRSGVWAIGRTRVLRLEQTLEGLVGGAPDDVTAGRCTTLSSAVEALRRVLDQSEAAGVIGGEATTTALRQAQGELDEAVVALQRRNGGGGPA